MAVRTLRVTERQRQALGQAIAAYEALYVDGPPVAVPDEYSGRAERAEYNRYARNENKVIAALNELNAQLEFTPTESLEYK